MGGGGGQSGEPAAPSLERSWSPKIAASLRCSITSRLHDFTASAPAAPAASHRAAAAATAEVSWDGNG